MHDGPGQGRHGVMQHRRSTGWVGLVLAIITASAASGATAQDAEAASGAAPQSAASNVEMTADAYRPVRLPRPPVS